MLVRLKVPFAPFCSGPPTLNQLPAFDSAQDWFLDSVPFSRGRDVARHASFRFLVAGRSRGGRYCRGHIASGIDRTSRAFRKKSFPRG